VIHTPAGRDLLLLTTFQGGRGPDVWVISLDTAGNLAFVGDGVTPDEAFTFAGIGGVPDCLSTQVRFTPPMQVTC
jgi:hypothetical protein